MQSSIYFGSYKSYDVNNYANYKSTNLCLLKRYLSLLENAPKNFTITTKNGSCKFNLELLKETSKVISDFIEDNHNLQFDFDIQDNENVLSKFESLYQGKKVVFDINDFPTFLKIKEKLNITCFYDSNNYIIHMNNHNNESKDNLNLISILNEGIQIHGVLDYLQINELPTFIIATKQNKYACNIFGVCSSKVIRNFIEKNPQEKKFVLEIDDEFDEFQPISELFNFDKIDLNKDNFELIKEFVEDLQIKCLLDDINEFIKNNNKISQKLDEQQKFVDLYDELFDMLHNIKEKTVEFVKNSILKSIWIETEENIQELAAFIIQAIKSDILLHPYIVDLLIQLNEEANESNYLKILLPFIVEKLIFYGIKHYSCSYNRYYEINENSLYPSFIYKLYKKGLMPKEKIISSLKNYSIQDKTVKGWFLPILNELKLLEETKKDEFFNKYLPDKIDIYVKMLDSEPDDMLTKSLRNDDVDTLQSIISRTNIDINKSYVPYNIFDNFMQNEKMSYLNYAAYFGSLKCFKYLLLNHANINKETFQCAIFGGNIEIIKIVDNNNLYHYDERDIEKQISNSIITYRNDLFDWLLEQKTNGNQQYLYSSIAFHSAKNGNIYSLIGIMDKGFDINNDSKQLLQYSSMNGFYRYFKFVLSILDKDQKSKYCNQNTYENICFYYVSFGNASIFKLYLEEFHDRNLESAIYCAIERNYMNIINTFFEYLLKYKKSNVSPNKILNAALRKETDELFIYLLSKLKTIYSKLVFNNELFMELLKDTCRLNNLTICNTITDIILSNKPKEDFSPAFKTAASNGSNEICQYFIDKKVFINFNKIIPKHKKEFIDIEKYGLLNVNVFSFLINNTDPELQENYSNCIYYSIKNKNKDLTEYLCNRFGVQSDFNFPFVVSQSDLDLVNIILKYNSRLEFINQVRNNRTALSTAVYYSCTPIVKRLLSIPGINASLSFNEYETPLSIAVKNKNLEIIDILIDFYGDSMKNKTHELDEIMKIITGSYSANNYDQKVIDRILKIEYIDPNYVFYEVQITINDERDSDNDSNTDYDTGDKYDDYNNDDDYDFDDFDYNIQSCSNDDTNEYNCNLLICACKNNDVDMVKMLLKLEKINVNQYSLKKGFTPLIAAIKNKSLEAAELLILYPKTDINQQDYDRNTALCYAVQNDLENIVDLLIKNEKFDHEKNRINHIFTFSHFPIATKLASIKMLDVNNIVYIYENTKHKRKIFYSTKLIESAKSNDIKMIDLIVHHPSFDKNKLPSKIWTYQIF